MMPRFCAILLPGGILPAEVAYPGLIAALGPDVDARYKEFELYAGDAPPPGWGLDTEVEGILRFAKGAGFDRFHLVGYSGGGACALAFCAAHPERLLSLTLNEPAWGGNEGWSDEERDYWRRLDEIMALPPDEMIAAFMQSGRPRSPNHHHPIRNLHRLGSRSGRPGFAPSLRRSRRTTWTWNVCGRSIVPSCTSPGGKATRSRTSRSWSV